MKSYLMFRFQTHVTVTNANFQKYLPRIAHEFGMPCDTVADQQLILNEIFELKSFAKKLGQPKASNWFAWNAQSKEQMREFTATKCVFAETYCDDPDPDD